MDRRQNNVQAYTKIELVDKYTLPLTDGTSGQVIKTNGAGTLSWMTAGSEISEFVGYKRVSGSLLTTGNFKVGSPTLGGKVINFGATTHSGSLYMAGNVRLGTNLLYYGSANDGNLSYTAGLLKSTKGLWTAANFLVEGDIYNNYNGPDGNSFIYFYEGSSITGAYISFTDTGAKFKILPGKILLSSSETNSVAKSGYLTSRHYTTANRDLAIAQGYSDSTQGLVLIGGGDSTYNAATAIRFYTAADNNTATGTLIAGFDSNGDLTLQKNVLGLTVQGRSQHSGSLYTTGNLKVGSPTLGGRILSYGTDQISGSLFVKGSIRQRGASAYGFSTPSGSSTSIGLYSATRIGNFTFASTDDYLTASAISVTQANTYIYLNVPISAANVVAAGEFQLVMAGINATTLTVTATVEQRTTNGAWASLGSTTGTINRASAGTSTLSFLLKPTIATWSWVPNGSYRLRISKDLSQTVNVTSCYVRLYGVYIT
jgi:hypothetical protein